MTLIEKIEADFLVAFKAKEELKVAVLRLLKSAIKNKMIEIKPATLEEAQVVAVIKSEIKKRKESIENFIKGGRQELADKEIAELKILETYLPTQMTLEQIKEKILAARQTLPEVDQNNFGKVMSAAMKETQGQADGQVVSGLVKEILA